MITKLVIMSYNFVARIKVNSHGAFFLKATAHAIGCVDVNDTVQMVQFSLHVMQ